MRIANDDTLGLYKVQVWYNSKPVATVKVFDYTRRGAYYEVMHQLPKHNRFDSTRIRDARKGEMPGIKIEKNDLKRKIKQSK